MKNPIAQALGRLAKGKSKSYSRTEIAKRTERLKKARAAAKKAREGKKGKSVRASIIEHGMKGIKGLTLMESAILTLCVGWIPLVMTRSMTSRLRCYQWENIALPALIVSK